MVKSMELKLSELEVVLYHHPDESIRVRAAELLGENNPECALRVLLNNQDKQIITPSIERELLKAVEKHLGEYSTDDLERIIGSTVLPYDLRRKAGETLVDRLVQKGYYEELYQIIHKTDPNYPEEIINSARELYEKAINNRIEIISNNDEISHRYRYNDLNNIVNDERVPDKLRNKAREKLEDLAVKIVEEYKTTEHWSVADLIINIIRNPNLSHRVRVDAGNAILDVYRKSRDYYSDELMLMRDLFNDSNVPKEIRERIKNEYPKILRELITSSAENGRYNFLWRLINAIDSDPVLSENELKEKLKNMAKGLYEDAVRRAIEEYRRRRDYDSLYDMVISKDIPDTLKVEAGKALVDAYADCDFSCLCYESLENVPKNESFPEEVRNYAEEKLREIAIQIGEKIQKETREKGLSGMFSKIKQRIMPKLELIEDDT